MHKINALKYLRIINGYSQKRLAKESTIPISIIKEVEIGNRILGRFHASNISGLFPGTTFEPNVNHVCLDDERYHNYLCAKAKLEKKGKSSPWRKSFNQKTKEPKNES